jgi:hypothetical protein
MLGVMMTMVKRYAYTSSSVTQVKMLVKGFQELGIVEKGKSMQYNYLNPTAIGLAPPPLDLLLNAGIVDALTDGDRPRRTLTLTVCVPDPRSLVRHGYSRLHDTHEGQTLGAGRCKSAFLCPFCLHIIQVWYLLEPAGGGWPLHPCMYSCGCRHRENCRL